MLASPAAVQDVFRGDPHMLHSGEGNEFLSASVGKNSVLVLDDEPHARQRRVLLPPLKGERMRSFFDAMQSATLEVIRAWPLSQPLEVLEPMQEITLRVILQVVLGLDPGAQLEDFAGKVRRVLELGRGRYGLIFVKILPVALLQRTRWLPFYRRMHDLDEALYAFLDKRRRQPASERGDNVLADLLAASHENGEPLSDQEIRDALVTIDPGSAWHRARTARWRAYDRGGKMDLSGCHLSSLSGYRTLKYSLFHLWIGLDIQPGESHVVLRQKLADPKRAFRRAGTDDAQAHEPF
jgi:cytochrome P450